MLEFKFDRKFEINQLLHALYQIRIMQDSVNVTFRAKPSYAGNYTNSLLLTFTLTKENLR